MKQVSDSHLLVLIEISLLQEKEFTIPDLLKNINKDITAVHIRSIIYYLREEDILIEIPSKFGIRKYNLEKEKLQALIEEQIIYKKIVEYLKTNSILIL